MPGNSSAQALSERSTPSVALLALAEQHQAEAMLRAVTTLVGPGDERSVRLTAAV